MVIIREVLEKSTDFFKKRGISTPRLDAEVLLSDLLGMERIQLYVNYNLPLREEELKRYREMLGARAKRIPVAYLTGKKEFMSLELNLSQDVLIPRPETELLVEEILDYYKKRGQGSLNIVDVGTGSGAIAVALAYYLPDSRVLATDISRTVLQLARSNIRKFKLEERVKIMKGDLLLPLLKMKKDNVDLIVSNPPYIESGKMEQLLPEVKQEPRLALDGGADGLSFYKKLIPQAAGILKDGGLLFMEIGDGQGEAVSSFFDERWSDIDLKRDYSGCERIIRARKET